MTTSCWCSLFGLLLSLIIIDGQDRDNYECLDISITEPRSPKCRDYFSVYLVLALSKKDTKAAEKLFDSLRPMLNPCMELEDPDGTVSEIRFVSLNQDQKKNLEECPGDDFQTISKSIEIDDSMYTWFAGEERIIQEDQQSDTGLLIGLMKDTVRMILECEPRERDLRLPLILFVTDIPSDTAAEKFPDLETLLDINFFGSFRTWGIVMKFVWTKEDEKLDKEMLGAMEWVKNISYHYVDYIIDDLSDSREVEEQFGMCQPHDGFTKDPHDPDKHDKEARGALFWILIILVSLVAFTALSWAIICLLFAKTSLLNRPARFLLKPFSVDSGFRVTFVNRPTVDDPDRIEDDGPPRYVSQSVSIRRRIDPMVPVTPMFPPPPYEEAIAISHIT